MECLVKKKKKRENSRHPKLTTQKVSDGLLTEYTHLSFTHL